MSESAAPGRVDVLFFRIGSARFGADASQVVRIERAGFHAELVDALGMPDEGNRALVFVTPSGERQMCVDAVEGIRTVGVDDLRRVPAAAAAPRGVLGLWLEGGQHPVVLIDLPTTVDAPGGPP
ncbi:MAG TPA: Frizzy aggregation protein FrzB [Myxococcaceae bacterium]|jgi:chemotaxis signal transduction protein|nr:Frizzy aggregation protein FrzB [Myxococcaceae bacterium]HZA51443.1 Frizzy aggregation protein FrzB [Myxococcaceae bacterium]